MCFAFYSVIKALPRSEFEERIEAKKRELLATFDAFKRSPAETVRQSAEHPPATTSKRRSDC
jgi:hypothetical protein